MIFNDYNQFFSFLDTNQVLLTKYAYFRELYNACIAVQSCSCKRQQRIAIAKSKYVMNAKMLGEDEDARNDLKKELDNEKIEMYNDGELLIEF